MRPRARPRKIGRPAAAVSAATRERILAAARHRFAASGFGQASNRQIAEAAGVTPPALYHWFASKAALFVAVQNDSIALLLDAYLAAAASSTSCVDRLCAAFEASVDLNREHPGLAEFLANAPLEIRRHPELARVAGDVGQRVARLFRDWIAAGVASGELRADLEIDAAVGLITALSFGLAWLRSAVAVPHQHEVMLRHAQSLIRGTLFTSGGFHE